MNSNTSNSVQIKICGLSTPESVETAIAAGASHIGFIFFPKSPRNVTITKAAELRKAAIGKVVAVAVTVDADNALLDEIASVMKPDMLQLHGKETPARIGEIKARYGLPIIKAIAIESVEDLNKAMLFDKLVDQLLFDAKAPAGSKLPGGNGVSFDWNILAGLPQNTNYMLSGGLDETNILSALATSHAKAIDVSSGVESSPGVKDIAKISTFIKTVSNMARTSS